MPPSSVSVVENILRSCLPLLEPAPRLTVSQWADAYRVLPSDYAAEPGPWSTERAPYQREIMDAISDPYTSEIVLMCSAQVGKTEMVTNMIGYFIDLDPCPILVIQPTVVMAQSWSKDRLSHMIRDTKRLRGKVKSPRVKDSQNEILHKSFPGGSITIIGANSPAGLASHTIRVAIFDEVEKYPQSAGTEGDPMSLASKRTTTYFNRKIVKLSTPTLKGCRIETEFLASDQRHYYVPCPHCEESQVLRWEQVRWQGNDSDTAFYECEKCNKAIHEGHRVRMLRRGRWVSHAKSKVTGFYLNELYSPWSSLSRVVEQYIRAECGGIQTKKVWVNTVLGLPWEESETNLESNAFLRRRESYINDCPAGVLVLTAGVDVQLDRIEVEVVGWGFGDESWSIAHRVFRGDTSLPEVWRDLSIYLLEEEFLHEYGMKLRISSTCIDSGNTTRIVYDFVKKHAGRRIFAIKGYAGQGRPPVTPPSKKRWTKEINRNVDVFPLGVDELKTLLYARLRISEPGPGYCHFSTKACHNEEYFRQITSEHVETVYDKGHAKRQWVLPKWRRNEILDCRVYATAAIMIYNPSYESFARNIRRPEDLPKVESEKKERPRAKSVLRNSFVTGWR